MFSLGASAFVGVKSSRPDLTIYIKTQQIINEGIYDPRYDFNGDGIVDEKDLNRYKRYLLGIISLEELYISKAEEVV